MIDGEKLLELRTIKLKLHTEVNNLKHRHILAKDSTGSNEFNLECRSTGLAYKNIKQQAYVAKKELVSACPHIFYLERFYQGNNFLAKCLFCNTERKGLVHEIEDILYKGEKIAPIAVSFEKATEIFLIIYRKLLMSKKVPRNRIFDFAKFMLHVYLIVELKKMVNALPLDEQAYINRYMSRCKR